MTEPTYAVIHDPAYPTRYSVRPETVAPKNGVREEIAHAGLTYRRQVEPRSDEMMTEGNSERHVVSEVEPSRTAFATRLTRLRTERGLTQGRLAARASLYTTQVCNYERGGVTPRGKALAQLAAALEVDVSELECGE